MQRASLSVNRRIALDADNRSGQAFLHLHGAVVAHGSPIVRGTIVIRATRDLPDNEAGCSIRTVVTIRRHASLATVHDAHSCSVIKTWIAAANSTGSSWPSLTVRTNCCLQPIVAHSTMPTTPSTGSRKRMQHPRWRPCSNVITRLSCAEHARDSALPRDAQDDPARGPARASTGRPRAVPSGRHGNERGSSVRREPRCSQPASTSSTPQSHCSGSMASEAPSSDVTSSSALS